MALEASQIGVWEHDLRDSRLLWDRSMHRLYDTGSVERWVKADVWERALHPDDRERALAEFEAAVAVRGSYTSQFRILLPNGDIRHIRSRAHFFEGPDGATSVIGAEWDVTADVLLNRELAYQKSVAEARAVALERSQKLVEHAANHDYLTGLPNRRSCDLQLAALSADAGVGSLAVVHIDIDRFKEINDKMGHVAGDVMLKAAGTRLTGIVPPTGLVARTGGDEFVVILASLADPCALRHFCEAALRLLGEPVMWGTERIETTVSIGAAWNATGNAENLLAESDLALYQAKKLGRNRIEFFTLALQAEMQGQRQLAEDLKRALPLGEIVPFYQVQIDARSGRIFGLEALARWNHPLRGLLSPAAFMKIADECGLTSQIDAAILARALADRAEWLAAGLTPPRIAVNVSAERLGDPHLLEALHLLAIPENGLSFELVETIFLDDYDDIFHANIEGIKAMGIEIEIDDFGSGHASLLGLVRLRPARLKIDRQLVTAITVSEEQRRLVASIVDIAKTLKVGVIAEGVESEAHAWLLTEIGCDGLQGYALGHPSPAAEIVRLLADAPAGTPDEPAPTGFAASGSRQR